MLGRDRIVEILDKAIRASDADMTQASIGIGKSSLTRFANSVIHQNVSEYNAQLSVKAIVGKRIGSATTNKLDDESIAAVTAKAIESARNSPENPDFVTLPSPLPVPDVDAYDARTADYSPEDRARDVAGVIGEGKKRGASAAGQFSTGYEEYAVANSLGVSAYYPATIASMTTVMSADSGFGYADRFAPRISELHPIEAAVEAATRSVRSKDPQPIEPGEYDVVLLPYAASDLIEFLSWLGLGAKSVQEGRSFMCGKFGEKITGDNITIWDDALDPNGIPRPFDSEGVPKQRVDLITNGVGKAVVYDTFTAKKEGRESTGHAISPVGSPHPLATNLFLEPGNATVDEMIASTERGILVTRFHYTNVIHPILTIITGMTRDGTFLIENGKISKPVKNMRFTDNVLERLANVEMLSRETMRQSWAVVPAIKARGFRFTGATEF